MNDGPNDEKQIERMLLQTETSIQHKIIGTEFTFGCGNVHYFVDCLKCKQKNV